MTGDSLTLGQLLDYFGKATIGAVLVTFIYGLKAGWWVMGRELKERDERIVKLEARIERFEAKDEKRSELLERTIDAVAPRKH